MLSVLDSLFGQQSCAQVTADTQVQELSLSFPCRSVTQGRIPQAPGSSAEWDELTAGSSRTAACAQQQQSRVTEQDKGGIRLLCIDFFFRRGFQVFRF